MIVWCLSRTRCCYTGNPAWCEAADKPNKTKSKPKNTKPNTQPKNVKLAKVRQVKRTAQTFFFNLLPHHDKAVAFKEASVFAMTSRSMSQTRCCYSSKRRKWVANNTKQKEQTKNPKQTRHRTAVPLPQASPQKQWRPNLHPARLTNTKTRTQEERSKPTKAMYFLLFFVSAHHKGCYRSIKF